MYGNQDPNDPRRSLQERLTSELQRKNIRPTPQAISSLLEAMRVSSWEIVGDSDTLLAGLLMSGSYTVDILETAGINPSALRRSTLDLVSYSSLSPNYSTDMLDPLEFSFSLGSLMSEGNALGRAIQAALNDGGTLETSHILEAAISPLSEEKASEFPLEDRSDLPPQSQLLVDLEKAVCLLLEDLAGCDIFHGRSVRHTLKTRRHPITKKEDEWLDKVLGFDFRDMETEELEFVIAALNQWFVHRRILTDPSNLCLRVVNRFEESLMFGPKLFAEADGDIKAVQIGLQNARKYSPERDLPSVALFIRNGRIEVGQYTYRNAFAVEGGEPSAFPLQRVHLQAIRPVPIISHVALAEFEKLISRESLKEREIQRFLSAYPEFLMSLGYSSARPHICLRPETHNKLVPDFILELPSSNAFDILDLKLPSTQLTARTPYLRVSSELMKAVAQLRRYGQCFEDAAFRKAFEKRHGLTAFKPELVVVMGRNSQFNSRDDRVEVESQLGGIRLVTYDDLIAYGLSRSLVLPGDILY